MVKTFVCPKDAGAPVKGTRVVNMKYKKQNNNYDEKKLYKQRGGGWRRRWYFFVFFFIMFTYTYYLFPVLIATSLIR